MQLGNLGSAVSSPSGSGRRRSPAANRHLVHFGVKMLYLIRPPLAKTYAWWSFTMSRVVLKGPERRSGAFRSHSNTAFRIFDVKVMWPRSRTIQGHPMSKTMVPIDSPGWFHIRLPLTPLWYLSPFSRYLALNYFFKGAMVKINSTL